MKRPELSGTGRTRAAAMAAGAAVLAAGAIALTPAVHQQLAVGRVANANTASCTTNLTPAPGFVLDLCLTGHGSSVTPAVIVKQTSHVASSCQITLGVFDDANNRLDNAAKAAGLPCTTGEHDGATLDLGHLSAITVNTAPDGSITAHASADLTIDGHETNLGASPTYTPGQNNPTPTTSPDSSPTTPAGDAGQPAVETALAQTRSVLTLKTLVTRASIQALAADLDALDSTGMDAYLAALSDTDIAALDNTLIHSGAVTLGLHLQLDNTIISRASARSLTRITPILTSLQPTLQTGSDAEQRATKWDWQFGVPLPNAGALYGASGGPRLVDAEQGDLDDCYFHAELLSLANTDPEWVEQSITAQANGSYTVTFYPGGIATKVYVTGNLPYYSIKSAQSGWTYGGVRNGIWIAIYEKAYAQLKGGYTLIEGGDPLSPQAVTGAAYTDLTGHSDDREGLIFGFPPSLDTLKGWLNAGKAVVASTTDYGDRYYDAPVTVLDDNAQPTGVTQSYTLHSEHEYVVVSVDTVKRTITLANPWGDGVTNTTPNGTTQDIPFLITISQDTYSKNFGDAASVPLL